MNEPNKMSINDIAKDAQRQIFKGVFENSPIGIGVINIKGEFIKSNRSLRDMLGYSASDFKNINFKEITYFEDLEKTNKFYDDLVCGNVEKSQFTTRYIHKNGSYVWVSLNLTSIKGNSKKPLLFVAHVINLHKHKKTEYMLKKKKKQLEMTNKEMEEILHILTHDMRESFRGFGGLSSILKNRIVNESKCDLNRCVKYIDLMINRSDKMDEMLDDILNYHRAGIEKNGYYEVNVFEILKNVIEIFEHRFVSENVKINVSENIKKMKNIYASKTGIHHIFQNLISNAIKFKSNYRKPDIDIDVFEEENYWKFSVKDNGIGIEKKFKNKVFEMFVRLNPNVSTGTGMGLPICKRIVARHGGDIYFESDLDKGSIFYFTISKRLNDIEDIKTNGNY